MLYTTDSQQKLLQISRSLTKQKSITILVQLDYLRAHVIWLNVAGDVLGELPLVTVLIILLQQLHIISDVLAEDVLAVNLGVKVATFSVIAWEALVAIKANIKFIQIYFVPNTLIFLYF